MEEIKKEIQKNLRAIGKDVFINILYPVLKNKFESDGDYDMDYKDVCKRYPEYAECAESDKSKKSRLSKAKAIFRNGWEREALILIAESTRVDKKSIELAKAYLAQLDHIGNRSRFVVIV